MRLRGIKPKLLLVVGGLVALLVILFLARSYQEKNAISLFDEKVRLTAEYDQILHLVDERARQQLALAAMLAGLPEAQKSFAGRQRQELLNLARPLFLAVQENAGVDECQFDLAPAVSFLRVHDPERYGDNLDGTHLSVLAVNRAGKAAAGLDRDEAGLIVRGVAPVSHDNKQVGTIAFGSRVDQAFLSALREQNHVEAAIVVPAGDGFQIVAANSDIKLGSEFFPSLKQAMQTARPAIYDAGSSKARKVFLAGPLQDVSGKTVGVVVVAGGLDDSLAEHQRAIFSYLTVGLLLICVLLFLVHFTVERLVSRPLREMVARFKQAGAGDLTQRMPVREVNCSAITNCGQTACVMYGKAGHCWEEAGSLAYEVQCPKIKNGVYESCAVCRPVFWEMAADETAELAAYFNSFMNKMNAMIKNTYDHNWTLTQSSLNLAAIAKQMSGGAEVTSSKSAMVAASAREMSSYSTSVAAAAEESLVSVKGIAGAIEHMSSIIIEGARHSDQARVITENGVLQARDVSAAVADLGRAVNEIGEVTESISEISAQTNLLALNATIEAARAGAAGRGFAVVANEIKELSRQTAIATGEIKHKIKGIQDSTSETVSRIEQILQVINKVNEIVSDIAVNENRQALISDETASGVSQAMQGMEEVTKKVAQSSAVVDDVSKDIVEVSVAARQMVASSFQVRKNADELLELAEQLQGFMKVFKV